MDLNTGYITSTPKAAWRNFDLVGAVEKGLGVPVRFDTDVNAAVLGEARWGAARDGSNCLYLTVGTGIGGGAIVGGKIVHGLTHPEMGHIRIPHDAAADPFAGVCPYHGDCFEGLASGPAIEARCGMPGQDLPPDHAAWVLEARYLALGIANFICTLSPGRILVGGGVMRQSRLYEMVSGEVSRILAGYVEKLPEFVPPQLGELAGVIGALALAGEVSARVPSRQAEVRAPRYYGFGSKCDYCNSLSWFSVDIPESFRWQTNDFMIMLSVVTETETLSS